MIGQAVAAIVSGQATNVLVFRSLNGRSGARYGRSPASETAAGRAHPGGDAVDDFFAPYGLLVPGQVYAMVAQRHMAEFGTTHEQLGAIAVDLPASAPSANPNAQMGGRPLTLDGYLEGRWLSRPLRLFDYCLETDGACAVVVSPAERAADSPHPTVLIRAVAQGSGPGVQGGTINPILMRETYTTWPSAHAARTLYQRAGVGPDDIDVAQIYDCFTITVLVQLEDYGFCAKGEGGPFAASGALGHRRLAADQHRRWAPVRGLHPRHEPHRRGRPPAARHVDSPGRRRRDVPGDGRVAAGDQRPDPAERPRERELATARATGRRRAGASWWCRVCRPAGHVLHLPRAYCATCDTFDVTWRPVAGRGHGAHLDGGRARRRPGVPGAVHRGPRRARRPAWRPVRVGPPRPCGASRRATDGRALRRRGRRDHAAPVGAGVSRGVAVVVGVG